MKRRVQPAIWSWRELVEPVAVAVTCAAALFGLTAIVALVTAGSCGEM